MNGTGIVVAGVDGSPGSRAALLFALSAASRRGDRLHVVAAVRMPQYWGPAYGMGSYSFGVPFTTDEVVADVRAAAQRMVDQTVSARPDLAAGVEITVTARAGSPARVLLAAAESADELVLGHRGRGVATSAVLGSVGLACVLHAGCPVTIVRPVPAPADAGARAGTVPARV